MIAQRKHVKEEEILLKILSTETFWYLRFYEWILGILKKLNVVGFFAVPKVGDATFPPPYDVFHLTKPN